MTATITDEMTVIQTAILTKTKTETDKVTMTEVSTVVQPTTFTSVWVQTQTIDNVSTLFVWFAS